MSNKLVRDKVEKKNKWKLKCWICLIAGIAFALVAIIIWCGVISTSHKMKEKLNSMVPGKDYFYEEITITDKDICYGDQTGTVEGDDYYLYYDSVKERKLYVDENTYRSYNIGDQIKAYTLDHYYYYFTKEAMLGNSYTDNEVSKGLGALLMILALGCFAGAAFIWYCDKGKMRT